MQISFSVGCLALLLALVVFWANYRFFHRGVKVSAYVVQIDIRKDSEGDDDYIATLEYFTPDNQRYHLKDHSLKASTWQVGNEVTVMYDPGLPRYAKVFNLTGIFGVPIFFAVLAAPFLMYALLAWFAESQLLK